MPLRNTTASYGLITRSLHWLTALLIISLFASGFIADNLAYDTAEAVARKTTVFSVHKTLGVAVFFVAVARILWALTQQPPRALHPERKMENFAAHAVHWALYIALVVVPLSGWIHHAAVDGFAPILWPFGQDLPFVVKSEALAHSASAVHWLFNKIMLAALVLHIAGAMKHVVIDRDDTMARMTHGRLRGVQDGPDQGADHTGFAAASLAILVYLVGFIGIAATAEQTPASQNAAPQNNAAAGETAATQGNWQVTEGSLGFSVQQMGSAVEGSFASWTADITFDDKIASGPAGEVIVEIDIGSMTLGSVTAQAKEPEFFDIATFPSAVFKAEIEARPEENPDGNIAKGTLTLRGAEKPVTLPFSLVIEGDTARMTGQALLDRRDFGMGASYKDEGTVGFGVTVDVDLTATRR